MELLGHRVCITLGLSNDAKVFSNVVFSNLYSHWQCMKHPVTSHPCQNLVLSDFLIFCQSGGSTVISLCCFNSYFGYY